MTDFKEYTVRVYKNRTEWLNKDGDLHHENGPAIEWADGTKEWWLNGWLLSEEQWKKEVAKFKKANQPNCDGKVVEIDGKKYRFSEVE